jgi:glucose-1-phosphate adenylyltransferase
MPRNATAHAPLTRCAMAFVLAGGRGSRLLELTDKRVKPAVYFGCKSRIIDFALSNALNSGIRHIAVATQYKAHSWSCFGFVESGLVAIRPSFRTEPD